jgi:hypothetical protein
MGLDCAIPTFSFSCTSESYLHGKTFPNSSGSIASCPERTNAIFPDGGNTLGRRKRRAKSFIIYRLNCVSLTYYLERHDFMRHMIATRMLILRKSGILQPEIVAPAFKCNPFGKSRSVAKLPCASFQVFGL